MKTLRAAVVAVAVLGASLVTAAPAHAASTVEAQCGTSVDVPRAGVPPWVRKHFHLSASGSYFVSGVNHVWTQVSYRLGGDSTGGKSNVNFRLRGLRGAVPDWNRDQTYWSYDSPDSLKSENTYTTPLGANGGQTVPDSEKEYLKFEAIFDVPVIGDPRCIAYTAYV